MVRVFLLCKLAATTLRRLPRFAPLQTCRHIVESNGLRSGKVWAVHRRVRRSDDKQDYEVAVQVRARLRVSMDGVLVRMTRVYG